MDLILGAKGADLYARDDPDVVPAGFIQSLGQPVGCIVVGDSQYFDALARSAGHQFARCQAAIRGGGVAM